MVAVRVEGHTLGSPTVLHMQDGRAATASAPVDPGNLRTFAGDGCIWSVAPGTPQGVAAVHDESTLQWVAGTTF